jgi:hypothetical protein
MRAWAASSTARFGDERSPERSGHLAHQTTQQVGNLFVELHTLVTGTCLPAGRGLPEQQFGMDYCGWWHHRSGACTE